MYSWYCPEASNEQRGPFRGLASGLHSFEETSQRWQAFGDTASDSTNRGFEPHTFRTETVCAKQLSERPVM